MTSEERTRLGAEIMTAAYVNGRDLDQAQLRIIVDDVCSETDDIKLALEAVVWCRRHKKGFSIADIIRHIEEQKRRPPYHRDFPALPPPQEKQITAREIAALARAARESIGKNWTAEKIEARVQEILKKGEI